jgi:hypothetical protein
MARKVYRVLPAGTLWELKHAGNVLYSHDNKDPVVSRGQRTAKANEPSQLVVHRADGTIEYEYTYGDDPYPPSG